MHNSQFLCFLTEEMRYHAQGELCALEFSDDANADACQPWKLSDGSSIFTSSTYDIVPSPRCIEHKIRRLAKSEWFQEVTHFIGNNPYHSQAHSWIYPEKDGRNAHTVCYSTMHMRQRCVSQQKTASLPFPSGEDASKHHMIDACTTCLSCFACHRYY